MLKKAKRNSDICSGSNYSTFVIYLHIRVLSKWILPVIKYEKLAGRDKQVWLHVCAVFYSVALTVCCKSTKKKKKKRKKTWGNLSLSLRKSFCHSSFILCQIKAFSLWPGRLLINTSLRALGLASPSLAGEQCSLSLSDALHYHSIWRFSTSKCSWPKWMRAWIWSM